MDDADSRSPGWHPDPANPSIQRWWNGISWGDQTRQANGTPIPPAAPAMAPRVVDPYAPPTPIVSAPSGIPPTRDHQFRRANPIGYAGVVLAFISILFNIFCVPSILAIIFSAIGIGAAQRLRKSGHRVTGWGWSVAGLIGGIVETMIYLSNAVN
jgi:hypothetical protein